VAALFLHQQLTISGKLLAGKNFSTHHFDNLMLAVYAKKKPHRLRNRAFLTIK